MQRFAYYTMCIHLNFFVITTTTVLCTTHARGLQQHAQSPPTAHVILSKLNLDNINGYINQV